MTCQNAHFGSQAISNSFQSLAVLLARLIDRTNALIHTFSPIFIGIRAQILHDNIRPYHMSMVSDDA
jgi:hypothetical protein